MDELIERLRTATERNYREQGEPRITCPQALARFNPGATGGCGEVINGHVCALSDPHPWGYVHQCYCNKYGDQLR